MRQIKLFLASPGDVRAERKAVQRAVAALQSTPYWQKRCIFELLAWEERVPPDAGIPPQDVVDIHMGKAGDCDIFICLFHSRIGIPHYGSDGESYPSGTVYEFCTAYRARKVRGKPRIMLYRGTKRIPHDADPTQLQEVKNFFARFDGPYREFEALIKTFRTVKELESSVRGDLEKHLEEMLADDEPPSIAPAPQVDSLLRSYLTWVSEQNRWLLLQGIREAGTLRRIELEKVYIALKAEPDSNYERHQAHVVHELDVRDLAPADPETLAPEDLTRADAEVIRKTYRPEQERKRRDRIPEVHTVGDAFRTHRWLVILGGPGSGKTTLSRWLVVRFATAMIRWLDQGSPPSPDLARVVRVPAAQIHPGGEAVEGEVELGPVRLPILVRVADYARAFAQVRRDERRMLPLAEYLGRHPAGKGAPGLAGRPWPISELNALFLDHLSRGHAIVILDGLDELTEVNRRQIVDEIHSFIRVSINNHGREPGLPSEQVDLGEPWSIGENQILVTSRPVGYDIAPIQECAAHFTVQPMAPPAVKHFCHAWTRAVLTPSGGEEIPATLAEQANAEAAELIRQIYDDTRPALRDLATNPLLVTILATVYRFNEGKLPDQRAELYDRAVDNLLRLWLEREECQVVGLQADELLAFLEPLAAHMHEHAASNGLIHIDEIGELITAPLAAWRQQDPADPLFQRLRRVVLSTLSDQVGLLTEQSDENYSFLHRTFQEFLAARHLLRDQARAAQEIADRFDSPLWREPILLALGFITVSPDWGPQTRARLLKALLSTDDPARTIIPRAALLILSALPEMRRAPEEILEEVASRLLAIYATRRRELQHSVLLRQIEGAFERLRSSPYADIVEWVLRQALRDPKECPDLLPLAAAEILIKADWFTVEIIEALLRATHHDRSDWGWPIDAALRLALCQRPSEAVWLLRPAPPLNQVRLLALLPLRRELEREPQMLAFLLSDLDWLCLITALYGGYGSTGLLRRLDQLQQQRIKKTLEEPVNDQLGDAEVRGIEKLYKKSPNFDPRDIYREPADPELSRRIRELLGAKRPAQDLLSFLEVEFTNARAPLARAEAGMALAILDPSSLSVSRAEADPAHMGRIVREQLGRVHESIREAIARTGVTALKAIPQDIPENHREDLYTAVLEANALNGGPPLYVSTSVPEIRYMESLSPDFNAYRDGEWWAFFFSGASDDAGYNLAIVMETIWKKVTKHTEHFIRSFALLSESRNRLAPYTIKWPLGEFLPRKNDTCSDYLLLLDAIETMPARFDFFGSGVLSGCKPFLDQHPEYLVETLVLANLKGDEFIGEARKLINAEEYPSLQILLDRTVTISNPYLRFRILRRLSHSSRILKIENQPSLLDWMIQEVEKIECIEDQVFAMESMLEYARSGATRDPLLKTVKMTRDIKDPENRARALVRLALCASGDLSREFIHQALESALSIVDARRKAEFLLKLRPIIQSQPENWALFMSVIHSVADPWEQMKALGHQSHMLHTHWHHLTAVWAPIYCGLLASEAELHSANHGPQTDGANEEGLSVGRRSPGALTLSKAFELDDALRRGNYSEVSALMPLFEAPEPATLPFIERWRAQPIHALSPLAELLLVEGGRITVENLRPLPELLRSTDDRLRYRAMLALHGRSPHSRNKQRRYSPQKVGEAVIEFLASCAMRLKDNVGDGSTTLSWVSHDIFHDSVPALEQWLHSAPGSGEDAEVALWIINRMEAAAPSVIERIVALVPIQPERVQKALLQALCQLAFCEQIPTTLWPALGIALRSIPETLLDLIGEIPGASAQALLLIATLKDLSADLDDLANIVEFSLDATRLRIDEKSLADTSILAQIISRIGREKYSTTEVDCSAAARECLGNKVAIRVLLHWTLAKLQADLNSRRSNDLLVALAALADAAPTDFAADADPDILEPLLVEVVERHLFWPARRAAMKLLGRLRKVSRFVVGALRSALRDVDRVQDAAHEAVLNFRRLDGEILPDLLAGLRDPSAVFAYATLHLLTVLAQAEGTPARDRRLILEAFAKAAPETGRPVYALISGSVKRIEFIDRLDHAIYRATFEISHW